AVVPRSDPTLALSVLREEMPLGRGVFVLDASDNNNLVPRLTIPLRVPQPAAAFEARVFGPFLVVRTRGRTGTPARFLELAAAVERVGKDLYLGDADVNYDTVRRAQRRLD